MTTTIRLAQGLVAVTTLVGVALFGALRFLYDRFYGAFGIRPEEVGLDFLAIVGRGGLEIAALLLVATAFAALGYALGTVLFLSLLQPLSSRRLLPRPRLTPWARSILVVLVCAVAPLGIFDAIDRSTAHLAKAYEQVTKGFRVEPSAFLAIRVEPVRVEWVAGGSPPFQLSKTLMLLGTGDGTLFTYDLETQSLVRLPANAVAVLQRCHPSYPGLCLAPKAPDVDCRDLPTANVAVREPDPYGLDADGDAVGCEDETSPAGRSSVIGGTVLLVVVALLRVVRMWGFEPPDEATNLVESE